MAEHQQTAILRRFEQLSREQRPRNHRDWLATERALDAAAERFLDGLQRACVALGRQARPSAPQRRADTAADRMSRVLERAASVAG